MKGPGDQFPEASPTSQGQEQHLGRWISGTPSSPDGRGSSRKTPTSVFEWFQTISWKWFRSKSSTSVLPSPVTSKKTPDTWAISRCYQTAGNSFRDTLSPFRLLYKPLQSVVVLLNNRNFSHSSEGCEVQDQGAGRLGVQWGPSSWGRASLDVASLGEGRAEEFPWSLLYGH